MPQALSGRIAAVTGASAGAGRAIAEHLARAGCAVGLIARDPEPLAATAAELEAQGARCVAAPADVADFAQLSAAADAIEAALGPIDIWVNDAMLTVFSPVERIAVDEFRRVTDVTYLGAVNGSLIALARMRPRGRGHIVQIGSALAYRGIPLQAAYCGAKHGIRGFTAALRTELIYEHSPIRLSIIELPAMNTPQFDWARTHIPHAPRPMGKIYQPEVAAVAVERALMTGAREYCVGKTTVMTVLGNAVAPAWLDNYLARTAYTGQQTDQPTRQEGTGNLFNPIGPPHATHGSFGSHAAPHALIIGSQTVRTLTIVVGALVFFALGLLF
jgi:short-subunit dehydrogenase